MITKVENKLYNKLTKEYQNRFMIVGSYFLNLIDENIINNNSDQIYQPYLKGLGYSAFHLYNDPETKKEFISVRNMLQDIHGKIDSKIHPNLSENICNVIIVLSDPEALENNAEYNNTQRRIWKEIVSESEELRHNKKFKKYLKKK